MATAEYDERGNLIATTDPLGHTTRYEVDDLGQLTAIIDALGKRKTLQWDHSRQSGLHTPTAQATRSIHSL